MARRMRRDVGESIPRWIVVVACVLRCRDEPRPDCPVVLSSIIHVMSV